MIDGIKKIIESSFLSVFEGINIKVEVGRNYKKVLQDESKKYSSWIIDTYGTFPLFGVNLDAHVDDLHIKLRYTKDFEREKFKDRKEVADDVKNSVHNYSGETIEEVIDNSYQIVKNKAHYPSGKKSKPERKVYSDVALLGVAGSGKTTTLKYLALTAARGRPFRGKKRIPIYISLRDIKSEIKSGCLMQEIAKFFSRFDFIYPEDTASKLVKMGSMILLIDGVDELSDELQAVILNEVDNIRTLPVSGIDKKNIICLSGRPYSLSRGLTGFMKYDVLAFNDSDRYRFIKKWYANIDPKRGERLIRKLQKNNAVRGIGSSPLLLSIICALEYNEYDIPSNLDELFESCILGLLGKWDAFRDISRSTVLSALSPKKRMLIVACIAARALINNLIVFKATDKPILQACIDSNRYMQDKKLDANELIECLYNDFGLLIERSRSIYSFSHLSFQEYLTGFWLISHQMELKFIAAIKSDLLRWSYVMEFVAKNIPRSAYKFVYAIHKKIDYRNHNEIDLLRKIITHKETNLSIEEKVKIGLEAALETRHHAQAILSDHNGWISNGAMSVSLDIDTDIEEVQDNYRCIRNIAKIVDDSVGEREAIKNGGDSVVFWVNFSRRGHDINNLFRECN